MKKRPYIFVLLFLAVQISCSPSQRKTFTSTDKIKTLSTITIIADFVSQVGGEYVESMSLLSPGIDPHTYEPVPDDMRAASQADIIFYNGLHLEKWLQKLLDASVESNTVIIVATKGIMPITNDRGDPDPHVWMDPINAIVYSENIYRALALYDPEHEQYYRQRANNYIDEILKLDAYVRTQINKIPVENRRLVTTHDAYAYYADRYGLELSGSIWGISTEDEPSAYQISSILDSIAAQGVKAVFIETTVNPKIMISIAHDANIGVGAPLYGDSLGTNGSGADTYIDMIKKNTISIQAALK